MTFTSAGNMNAEGRAEGKGEGEEDKETGRAKVKFAFPSTNIWAGERRTIRAHPSRLAVARAVVTVSVISAAAWAILKRAIEARPSSIAGAREALVAAPMTRATVRTTGEKCVRESRAPRFGGALGQG